MSSSRAEPVTLGSPSTSSWTTIDPRFPFGRDLTIFSSRPGKRDFAVDSSTARGVLADLVETRFVVFTSKVLLSWIEVLSPESYATIGCRGNPRGPRGRGIVRQLTKDNVIPRRQLPTRLDDKVHVQPPDTRYHPRPEIYTRRGVSRGIQFSFEF